MHLFIFQIVQHCDKYLSGIKILLQNPKKSSRVILIAKLKFRAKLSFRTNFRIEFIHFFKKNLNLVEESRKSSPNTKL